MRSAMRNRPDGLACAAATPYSRLRPSRARMYAGHRTDAHVPPVGRE